MANGLPQYHTCTDRYPLLDAAQDFFLSLAWFLFRSFSVSLSLSSLLAEFVPGHLTGEGGGDKDNRTSERRGAGGGGGRLGDEVVGVSRETTNYICRMELALNVAILVRRLVHPTVHEIIYYPAKVG